MLKEITVRSNWSVLVKPCRHYLLTRKFVILTDNKSLEWLAKEKSLGLLGR